MVECQKKAPGDNKSSLGEEIPCGKSHENRSNPHGPTATSTQATEAGSDDESSWAELNTIL